MIRILYVSTYYKPAYVYGGPVRCMALLCEEMVRLGAAVSVITTDANGPERLDVSLRMSIKVSGVEVSYYPSFHIPMMDVIYSPELVTNCQRIVRDYDVVIVNALYNHILGPVVAQCRRFEVPYILSMHGQTLAWAVRRHRLRKKIYFAVCGKRYLTGAAALHCTSPEEAETVGVLGGGRPVILIPYGIDVSFWGQPVRRGGFRRVLGLRGDDQLVVMLGRLHAVKHPELLVECLATEGWERVNVAFVGPDEGRVRRELGKRSEKLGVGERLHFTGVLNTLDVRQALVDADVVAMPSEAENFGMAALEALAVGTPLVTSPNVPVGKWAAAAGAALVAPLNTTSLSQAIADLLARPQAACAMGEAGRRLAAEGFHINAIAQKMLSALHLVADGAASDIGWTLRQYNATHDLPESHRRRTP